MPANDLEQSVDRTVDETRANQTASPPLTPNRHALDGERQPPRTRNRGGAPKGNKNRTTHGLKGSQLPPKCIRDQFTIRQIVNAVIDACEARHGHAITVHQSAIIHRIRRAATRDRLAARWLRLEGDKLPIEQRMALTEQMEAAAETIEKCLRLLKLDTADAAAADPFAKLNAASRAARTPGRFSGSRNQPEATQTTSEPQNAAETNGEKPTNETSATT